MIQNIKTVAEYEVFTQQKGVVIVHFWADWNAHDRTMRRTLIELKPEFTGEVDIGAVDIDESGTVELLQRINLLNVPTLVYFLDGNHISTEIGMIPMFEIREKIKRLLSRE